MKFVNTNIIFKPYFPKIIIMTLLLDNDYCKLAFFPEFSTLILKWKNRIISLEEYKHPFLLSLEFQSKTKFDSFISDLSEEWAIPEEYREWFQKEAVPVAVAQGLKRVALVSGSNIFKRFYINHIMNTTNQFGLPLKMFSKIEEAKAWIKLSNTE
jgi:hypothetical protein